MGTLTAELKVRIEQADKDELEQRAERIDRKPAALVRRYIREGLERDRQAEEVRRDG